MHPSNPQAKRFDPNSGKQYFVVHLPEPLAPKSEITLGISYSVLSSLRPRPAVIQQNDKQFLTYTFSAYVPSAYQTLTQKTKLKFPSINVPDYTQTSGLKSGADPSRKGSTYTYGPYETAKIAPGTEHPITVRYEFTKPVITAHLLERDVEVSHWGGNLASEERFWLRHNGSQLANQFSRVEWTFTSYQNAPSSALRDIPFPLQPGSMDPYYIDDIGNVSTSHFRAGNGKTAANLELKPRYPLFGGWNYSFRVGWNNDLAGFLRQATGVDSYVLKVPFLQGPKIPEGIQYERVVVRVVLPEGAHNVRFETVEGTSSNGLPGANHIKASLSSLKTYMDTLGRTTLTLEVNSVTDEARDAQLVVCLSLSLPHSNLFYDLDQTECLQNPRSSMTTPFWMRSVSRSPSLVVCFLSLSLRGSSASSMSALRSGKSASLDKDYLVLHWIAVTVSIFYFKDSSECKMPVVWLTTVL